MNVPLSPELELVRQQLRAATCRDVAPITPPQRRRHRALALMAATLVLVSGVAAASPVVRGQLFPDDPRPSADRMIVFSTDFNTFHTPSEHRIPKAVLASLAAMISDAPKSQHEEMNNGELLPSSHARVLLDHPSMTIYGIPTLKHRVCFVSTGPVGGGGGCLDRFRNGEPVSIGFGKNGPSSPWTVAGLAADEVEAVEISASDGRTHQAVMGTNAYFWQGSDNEIYALRLTAVLRSGERQVMDVSGGERSFENTLREMRAERSSNK